MKLLSVSLISLCLFSVSSISAATGNAEAGQKKSAVCASCHGADGQALLPTYPNLAGQNAEYLVLALQAYRSKERQGGNAALMHAMAANLSDEDIDDLSAYFASLK